LPIESSRAETACPNFFCGTHCKFGKQNADSTSAPMPIEALLAGYFTLPAIAQIAGQAAPLAMANRPPPPPFADPPHAILHCCLRI